MSIDLHELDREVGLAPLPYWERMIEESVARQKLCKGGHVRTKDLRALLHARHATLSNLTQGQFDRSVARVVEIANITQPAMLDLICKSWGM